VELKISEIMTPDGLNLFFMCDNTIEIIFRNATAQVPHMIMCDATMVMLISRCPLDLASSMQWRGWVNL
jgi:hypothetical protein